MILAELVEVSEVALSKEGQFDAILLKTSFNREDIGKPSLLKDEENYILQTRQLIDKARPFLKDGGLFFIWGLPNYLSFLGEHLSQENVDANYSFKYWISVELKSADNVGLPSSHLGLLMYLKSKSTKNPTPFHLNTKFVRVPYTHCPACNEINKDWGGKKHLLNPLGSAISDVWDFHDYSISNENEIPSKVIERILALLGEGKVLLQINQTESRFEIDEQMQRNDWLELVGDTMDLQINEVVQESCTAFSTRLKTQHPEGVFDLAFADPPYNLDKGYSTYKDDHADEHYISWCNEWLDGMYQNLKPGGALFVLNIPKWSIYHFNYLANKMIFKNWIVWDALSTPAGKLLPAHYSLLYFVKPGGRNATVNLETQKMIVDRDFCLKSSCIKKRNKEERETKEVLTDIWKDVHRIKHKKDRDHHPCQLPTKFMERIVKLFSNEGDLVFDPFGGAGTTAIAAKGLNRKYIVTEVDPLYVQIAKNNLGRVVTEDDGFKYKRESIRKAPQHGLPKKQFEKRYLDLCTLKEKPITKDEINEYDENLFLELKNYKGDFKKLFSTAKRRLEILELPF